MRLLVVFSHPAQDSFQASILRDLLERLSRDGHQVRTLDLYAEGFDPVLALEAWRDQRADRSHAAVDLSPHIAALREAEGLILVYPTWWYGMPAMLKGWFDRVWQPGVAFAMQDGVFQTRYLPGLTRFAAITTYGSPRRFIEWMVGDPERRQLMRGLALQFAPRVKTAWAPIYLVDGKTEAELARERASAVARVAKLMAGR